MRAALHTRLRGAAAGPLLGFDRELTRFLPWLPPSIQPLAGRLRRWRARYRQAGNVQARLDIEREALADLRRPLAAWPGPPLIRELLARIDQAQARSLAERRQALAGKACDPGLDERLLQELLTWLEGHPGEPELGALLARLLRAWWTARHAGDQANPTP